MSPQTELRVHMAIGGYLIGLLAGALALLVGTAAWGEECNPHLTCISTSSTPNIGLWKATPKMCHPEVCYNHNADVLDALVEFIAGASGVSRGVVFRGNVGGGGTDLLTEAGMTYNAASDALQVGGSLTLNRGGAFTPLNAGVFDQGPTDVPGICATDTIGATYNDTSTGYYCRCDGFNWCRVDNPLLCGDSFSCDGA